MTGSKRKLNFFMPNIALPLAFEVLRLKRKFKRSENDKLMKYKINYFEIFQVLNYFRERVVSRSFL